uniref:Putative salivary lipocalin n=1 Tax=Ixodes ricinus TaxID=34613 RepID=A0A0K8RA70_IXORI
MYLQSLIVIFCLLICSYTQDTAETTQLPEDDPENFPYQNATKTVELGGRHWVKRRTYTVRTHMGEPICEYAQIHGKVKDNEYTLELGAKIGSRWTSKNQTLLLETTGQHPAPNVLNFTRLSADGRLGHPLLYSDYQNCSIVRIMKKNSTEYRCDMLLLNEAAKNSPPSECEERFKRYCNGTAIEVYSSSCETTGAEAM